jgi:hypothetical protein
MEWGMWMESANRQVALTEVGPLQISTVFLGLDRSLVEGAPILFETIIFGFYRDEYQTRCSNWERAEVMHKGAVELATQWVRKAARMVQDSEGKSP